MYFDDVKKIKSMDDFETIRDLLNLTDRQKFIFDYKLHHGWKNISIAEELGIDQRTVGRELKVVADKLECLNIGILDKIKAKDATA